MKLIGGMRILLFPLSRWRERAGVRVASEVRSAFGYTTLTRRSSRCADLSRQRERRKCEQLPDSGRRA